MQASGAEEAERRRRTRTRWGPDEGGTAAPEAAEQPSVPPDVSNATMNHVLPVDLRLATCSVSYNLPSVALPGAVALMGRVNACRRLGQKAPKRKGGPERGGGLIRTPSQLQAQMQLHRTMLQPGQQSHRSAFERACVEALAARYP
jgi:hypothetical protein